MTVQAGTRAARERRRLNIPLVVVAAAILVWGLQNNLLEAAVPMALVLVVAPLLPAQVEVEYLGLAAAWEGRHHQAPAP